MNEATVSVIIPTHDRRRLLGECVASLRRQSVPPAEIIVVDDGSSDGTNAEELGEDVVFLRQEQRGVAAARNLGVAQATGEWLAFLDSDDLWDPERIERQLQAIGARPDLAWHYCDSRAIDADGAPLPSHRKQRFEGDVALPLFRHVFIHTSGVFMRRALFAELGGFREELMNCEDYDLWLRASLAHPVGHLPECLYARRHHAGSLSRSPDARALDQKCAVLEAAAERLLSSGRARLSSLRSRLVRAHFVAARAWAKEGDRSRLLRHRRRVLELRPWALRTVLLRVNRSPK